MKIHHLGHGQSERILWLCEELELPYELVKYTRDPVTRLAPPELLALHPMGAAPVLETEGMLLAESPAIVDFLLARHGAGRLRPVPEHPDFAAYLYWFHFANGNLQPLLLRAMALGRAVPEEHPVRRATLERQAKALAHVDARLANADHLAGDFGAADIMTVFSLTTMRLFYPVDLGPYPAIRAYLQRIGARPAYRRAMAKGDPDLVPLLT